MEIDDVYELIKSDMDAVNNTIKQRLYSDVVLINQISHHIINSGGKRLRPVLVLLSARALGYDGEHHIELAAIIEFIHTATLLHDDVVDNSELRRGKETANTLWGNEASVLVGDFLYSRSFQMMVDVGDMRVMEILAGTTNTIAEGEVLQLLNCNDADTTEERYITVIHYKTAKLFEAASQLGAVISKSSSRQEQAMLKYGMHLGTAFQLVDDMLDYSAPAREIGKNAGDDLAEGKPTLPLIYAMRHGTAEQASIVRRAIECGSLEDIDQIREVIETTNAIAYTAETARKEAGMAMTSLEGVPDSPYKQALITLADFSINRTY